mmetsp:Transcript_1891/g.4860  ORF Transcript_1891/g.4860 Transcript_1891/m.4860 type:complete len:220 (+) Transcript_1891:102-761(+)
MRLSTLPPSPFSSRPAWMSLLMLKFSKRDSSMNAKTKPDRSMSAAAVPPVTLRSQCSCPHSETSLYALTYCASLAVIRSTASCSWRCTARFAASRSMTFVMQYTAMHMEPICPTTDNPRNALARTFQMDSWPGVTLAMKAPARTQGVSTRITGAVPISISSTLSFKMPQVTLTGQSGPPTRTDTLPTVRPLAFRICSMARVGTLSTPMSCWILTDLPMK